MKRRELLGGLGGAGALASAGCLGVSPFGEEKPLRLRALPAAGDETDVRCTLDPAVVRNHPALEDALQTAADLSVGERATRDVTRETAEAIDAALQRHCEKYRGLYRYRGDWFFVSIAFKSGADAADHHDGTDDGHAGHDHTHGG